MATASARSPALQVVDRFGRSAVGAVEQFGRGAGLVVESRVKRGNPEPPVFLRTSLDRIVAPRLALTLWSTATQPIDTAPIVMLPTNHSLYPPGRMPYLIDLITI